jgi:hypothetical protein
MGGSIGEPPRLLGAGGLRNIDRVVIEGEAGSPDLALVVGFG